MMKISCKIDRQFAMILLGLLLIAAGILCYPREGQDARDQSIPTEAVQFSEREGEEEPMECGIILL